MTHRKTTEVLIHRATNYPNLLSEMLRHCCLVKIFYFGFLVFYREMTEIIKLIAKTAKQEKCHKVSFPMTQQNSGSRF